MRNRDNLILRKVSLSDSSDLWKWRNDPSTRRHSIVQKPVSWKQHQRWLQDSLKNKRRHLYLAMHRQAKVGMIRFDVQDKHILEVSINMSPDYRGQGFGKQCLVLASKCFKKKYPNFLQKAVIKQNNKISQKIFSYAGFVPVHKLEKTGRCLWIKP